MKIIKVVAVLHNIRSLHNVGSIFRTADAAGVEKIYLCGITPKPTDRLGAAREQFKKVSLGAEKYVDWEYTKRTADAIKKLRREGFKIFAVEQNKKSTPYYKVLPFDSAQGKNKRVALIFGNEVRGLPPSILKLADKILEIPMFGGKESLNVSVAFGIVVFGLRC